MLLTEDVCSDRFNIKKTISEFRFGPELSGSFLISTLYPIYFFMLYFSLVCVILPYSIASNGQLSIHAIQ